MREVTIILPMRDNTGATLKSERLTIESTLLTLASGFTRELVSGVWTAANGRRHMDRSYRYDVICSNMVAHSLREAASGWASLLRQDVLYYGDRSANVHFIAPLSTVA